MTPAAGGDRLDSWGEALSDRVSPIVVKELRQGLRSRTFAVFFGLMLVTCLLISLGFLAAAQPGEAKGPMAFSAYFAALALVQFFVIPYSAYRSMAREREEETWVLLTLTGLGARRILLGKLGSAVLQGALYSSGAAPFLLFSYYLNGVDLPTILVALVAAVAYQVFLVSVAISVATLAETKATRAVLHFALLGGLLVATTTGVGVSVSLAEEARSLWATGGFWLIVSASVFGFASTGVLLFQLAAARLSLSTEEYARGPRLAMAAQLAGLALFFVWAWADDEKIVTLLSGAVSCAYYVAMVGVLVTADRDGMALVHWQTGHRWAWHKPGALRGMLVGWAALVVTSGVFLALAVWKAEASKDRVLVFVAAPAYVLLYTSAAQVFARWVPHGPAQTATLVRLMLLGLVALGSSVPPLLGSIFSTSDDLVLNALNPVLGLKNLDRRDSVVLAVGLWAVALLFAGWALVVLLRRDTEPAE